MNIIEKLGIKPIESHAVRNGFVCDTAKVRIKEKIFNEMLEALIDFKKDMYGMGIDADQEFVDLLESHLLIFTRLIEKIGAMPWEKIKELYND